MDKKRIKKIAILAMISSMLLSGCGKKEPKVNTEAVKHTVTTENKVNEEEYKEVITNETINDIYNEYIIKSNENIKIEDLSIKEVRNPKYLSNKGEDYIYDYRVNGYNTEGYTNIDPGYHSKMYAVILKTDDKCEAICALVEVNGEIHNVKVSYLDGDIREASKYYVYIDPTKVNLENIKNGQEYIDSDFKNIESKKYELKNNYLA